MLASNQITVGAEQEAAGERAPLVLPSSEPSETKVQLSGQNRPASPVQRWLDGAGGNQMPSNWSVV